MPIDLESIRLGVKGKIEIFTNVAINMRLGLAHWEYGTFTPQQLTTVAISSAGGGEGNES
ncbi:MAG: hypothetical protein QMC62_02355 [Alteromonadaceae bacterium]|jgi:hypothetical protein